MIFRRWEVEEFQKNHRSHLTTVTFCAIIKKQGRQCRPCRWSDYPIRMSKKQISSYVSPYIRRKQISFLTSLVVIVSPPFGRAALVALFFCSARKGAAVKCLGQFVHLAQRRRPLPSLMSADRAPARIRFSSICTKKESPAMPDLPFSFPECSPGRKEKTRRGGRGCLGSAPARFFCPYSSASIRLTM